MKKIILILTSLILLTGCGKMDKDKLIEQFVSDVEGSKSYKTESKMEIYSGEDTFSYNLTVSYMDDDYFKVDMVNSLTNHEQIILRSEGDVYVVTPELNKSYKFSSEWPYNSSQSYILSTIVKDLTDNEDVTFLEEENGYCLQVGVTYPNNSNLKYEKVYFSNEGELEEVVVYDTEDIISIKVVFNEIDYKANLKADDFDVNLIIEENCCETYDESTASLDDIIYPLYIPSNTYLSEKELVDTENGERAILTFSGDKNFVLIEEVSSVSSEFEVIPIYGDPLMLSNTIGALSSNSLSWTVGMVDYYLASDDLTASELLSIADSLTTSTVSYEK